MPLKKYAKVETELGERLRKAIKLFGYKNTNEFVLEKKLKKSTVYGILNHGKSPSSETLSALKDIGINPIFILKGEGPALLLREAEIKESTDTNELKKASGELAFKLERLLAELRRLKLRTDITDDVKVVEREVFIKMLIDHLEDFELIELVELQATLNQIIKHRRRAEQERPAK